MKNLKLIFSLFLTTLFLGVCSAQNKSSKIAEDFAKLSGSWEGSLTYLDYSTGKPYTMSANVEIKRSGKTNKFIFSNIYPNEMSANSTDSLSVSKVGRFLDKESIRSRNVLADGMVEIITEIAGKDGNENRKAMIRQTYLIGANSYRKIKEVKFSGEKVWIKRHEYSYTKVLKK